MESRERTAAWRTPSFIGAGLAIALTVGLAVALSTTGSNGEGFAAFVGRFHPLAVHLPIGILLLVVLVEVASFHPGLRARVDPAIGLILPALVISGVVSFGLGQLLAHGGGYPQRLVTLHRRMTFIGVILMSIALAAWSFHTSRGTSVTRGIYRGVLGLAMLLLTLGAHHGGSMTRGEGYLSELAPKFLKPLLGGKTEETSAPVPPSSAAPSDEPLMFADVILPMLRDKCVECHGPDKTKGKLRLDDWAGLQKGGEHGAVVVSGDATKSPLYARMVLPKEDEERMPPEDKPGLSADEMAVVRWWIERGASDTMRVRDTLMPEGARNVLNSIVDKIPRPAELPMPKEPTPSDPTPEPSTSSDASSPTPAPIPSPSPVALGTDGLVFRDAVQPILNARCGSCHGAEKQKGKLRIDTIGALFKGGSDGPSIVAGSSASSSLVTKMKLPLDHDDHMPPKKSPQMSAPHVALVAWWIDEGAKEDTAFSALPSELKTAVTPPRATPKPVEAPPVASTSPPVASTPPVATGTSPESPPLTGDVMLAKSVVAPFLNDKCGTCHGPGGSGGLSVVDVPALLEGGNSGPAMVAGQPKKSLLLTRLHLPMTDDEHMPPEDSPQPSPLEIEAIELWIQHGATPDLVLPKRSVSPGLIALAEANEARSASPDGPHVTPLAKVDGEGTSNNAEKEASPAGAPSPPKVAPQGSGCGGCAIASTDEPHALLLASLTVLACLARRHSRRRSNDRHRASS